MEKSLRNGCYGKFFSKQSPETKPQQFYKGNLLKWFSYMYVVIVINVVLVDLVERT